jgi:tetrathionate reductase subunit B
VTPPSSTPPERTGPSAAPETVDRREFVETLAAACATGLPLLLAALRVSGAEAQAAGGAAGDASVHTYGMGVDVNKCIGCGRCVFACKTENDVPMQPGAFNTWVERYVIRTDGEVLVDSPDGGLAGFPPTTSEVETRRTFFVPKLCNHCAKPPCVQVCPVGATFISPEGVVLVDEDYCIGCRYCIQACPYGARWFHPVKKVAQKCTFCYHRITKGLKPACVEACPTGARIFGEIEGRATPLARFIRFNDLETLKPHLNTKPKVYYANLDVEVR